MEHIGGMQMKDSYIKGKTRKIPLITKEKMLKLHKAGWSYQSISLECGLPVNKVVEIIKENEK